LRQAIEAGVNLKHISCKQVKVMQTSSALLKKFKGTGKYLWDKYDK